MQPGTLRDSWTFSWPPARRQRVVIHRFAVGGFIRSVRVLLGSTTVPGPPHEALVGCRGRASTAQQTYLWDGQYVYVVMLLRTGTCPSGTGYGWRMLTGSRPRPFGGDVG